MRFNHLLAGCATQDSGTELACRIVLSAPPPSDGFPGNANRLLTMTAVLDETHFTLSQGRQRKGVAPGNEEVP